MKNYELNSKQSNFKKELMNLYQECILSDFPIVTNRMEALFENQKRLDVAIEFINNDKESYSRIEINNKFEIFVLGLLDIDTIYDLLNFLLEDHDVITEFMTSGPYMCLSSVVDYMDSKQEGMVVKEINITFNFNRYSGLLKSSCEEMIATKFEKNMHRTSYYREVQKEKIENIVDSFTDEDLKNILGLLTPMDRKRILCNMPIDCFYELYNEYQKQKETGFSRKLELKEENNE